MSFPNQNYNFTVVNEANFNSLVANSASVAGDVSISGDLAVAGNIISSGHITQGDLDVTGNLTVTGRSALVGAVTIGAALNPANFTVEGGAVDVRSVASTATFGTAGVGLVSITGGRDVIISAVRNVNIGADQDVNMKIGGSASIDIDTANTGTETWQVGSAAFPAAVGIARSGSQLGFYGTTPTFRPVLALAGPTANEQAIKDALVSLGLVV